MEERLYWVITPEYEYSEYLDGWAVDRYSLKDCVEIVATSKRDAVSKAVTEMLADKYSEYCKNRKRDNLNPFVGVQAMLAECGHGVAFKLDDEEYAADCWVCHEIFHHEEIGKEADDLDELEQIKWELTQVSCAS